MNLPVFDSYLQIIRDYLNNPESKITLLTITQSLQNFRNEVNLNWYSQYLQYDHLSYLTEIWNILLRLLGDPIADNPGIRITIFKTIGALIFTLSPFIPFTIVSSFISAIQNKPSNPHVSIAIITCFCQLSKFVSPLKFESFISNSPIIQCFTDLKQLTESNQQNQNYYMKYLPKIISMVEPINIEFQQFLLNALLKTFGESPSIPFIDSIIQLFIDSINWKILLDDFLNYINTKSQQRKLTFLMFSSKLFVTKNHSKIIQMAKYLQNYHWQNLFDLSIATLESNPSFFEFEQSGRTLTALLSCNIKTFSEKFEIVQNVFNKIDCPPYLKIFTFPFANSIDQLIPIESEKLTRQTSKLNSLPNFLNRNCSIDNINIILDVYLSLIHSESSEILINVIQSFSRIFEFIPIDFLNNFEILDKLKKLLNHFLRIKNSNFVQNSCILNLFKKIPLKVGNQILDNYEKIILEISFYFCFSEQNELNSNALETLLTLIEYQNISTIVSLIYKKIDFFDCFSICKICEMLTKIIKTIGIQSLNEFQYLIEIIYESFVYLHKTNDDILLTIKTASEVFKLFNLIHFGENETELNMINQNQNDPISTNQNQLNNDIQNQATSELNSSNETITHQISNEINRQNQLTSEMKIQFKNIVKMKNELKIICFDLISRVYQSYTGIDPQLPTISPSLKPITSLIETDILTNPFNEQSFFFTAIKESIIFLSRTFSDFLNDQTSIELLIRLIKIFPEQILAILENSPSSTFIDHNSYQILLFDIMQTTNSISVASKCLSISSNSKQQQKMLLNYAQSIPEPITLNNIEKIKMFQLAKQFVNKKLIQNGRDKFNFIKYFEKIEKTICEVHQIALNKEIFHPKIDLDHINENLYLFLDSKNKVEFVNNLNFHEWPIFDSEFVQFIRNNPNNIKITIDKLNPYQTNANETNQINEPKLDQSPNNLNQNETDHTELNQNELNNEQIKFNNSNEQIYLTDAEIKFISQFYQIVDKEILNYISSNHSKLYKKPFPNELLDKQFQLINMTKKQNEIRVNNEIVTSLSSLTPFFQSQQEIDDSFLEVSLLDNFFNFQSMSIDFHITSQLLNRILVILINNKRLASINSCLLYSVLHSIPFDFELIKKISIDNLLFYYSIIIDQEQANKVKSLLLNGNESIEVFDISQQLTSINENVYYKTKSILFNFTKLNTIQVDININQTIVNLKNEAKLISNKVKSYSNELNQNNSTSTSNSLISNDSKDITLISDEFNEHTSNEIKSNQSIQNDSCKSNMNQSTKQNSIQINFNELNPNETQQYHENNSILQIMSNQIQSKPARNIQRKLFSILDTHYSLFINTTNTTTQIDINLLLTNFIEKLKTIQNPLFFKSTEIIRSLFYYIRLLFLNYIKVNQNYFSYSNQHLNDEFFNEIHHIIKFINKKIEFLIDSNFNTFIQCPNRDHSFLYFLRLLVHIIFYLNSIKSNLTNRIMINELITSIFQNLFNYSVVFKDLGRLIKHFIVLNDINTNSIVQFINSITNKYEIFSFSSFFEVSALILLRFNVLTDILKNNNQSLIQICKIGNASSFVKLPSECMSCLRCLFIILNPSLNLILYNQFYYVFYPSIVDVFRLFCDMKLAPLDSLLENVVIKLLSCPEFNTFQNLVMPYLEKYVKLDDGFGLPKKIGEIINKYKC